MRTIHAMLWACAVALPSRLLVAQSVPAALNYQGRLTANTPGQEPVNATVPMRFEIYAASSGGTALWREPDAGLPACAGVPAVSTSVSGGIFNVALGATCAPVPSALFSGANADRYLQITVNPGTPGEEILAPRQKLSAAAYANLAQRANDSVQFGGASPAAYQGRTASGAFTCGPGTVLQTVGADGAPACVSPQSTLSAPLDLSGSLTGAVFSATNTGGGRAASFTGPVQVTGALTATSVSGAGSGLTALSASNLASGTVPDARLSSNVVIGGQGVSRLTNDAGYLTQAAADGRYAALRPTPAQLATLNWYGVNRTLEALPTQSGPFLAACDGENVWVANVSSSTLTKYRAIDGTLLGNFFVVPTPVGLVFDGEYLWVGSQVTNKVTKYRTSDVNYVADATVGTTPAWLAFDGTYIWSANIGSNNISKVRAVDAALIGNYPVGNAPVGLAFDGTNLWVANSGDSTLNRVNPATGAVTATLPTGANPRSVVFDGTYVWTANQNSGTVTRFNAATATAAGSFPVGSQPRGMVFDGAAIWIANNGDNTVTRLRATDGALLGTYPTGAGPFGLTFDGVRVWVTNNGANTVSRF